MYNHPEVGRISDFQTSSHCSEVFSTFPYSTPGGLYHYIYSVCIYIP